jgi:hypothetical protein
MTAPSCKWCGGPIPPSAYKLSAPRVYCSRECDIARRTKRDYYAEEVEHLATLGTSPALILRQLGVKPANLERALHRAGRHDLAALIAPFARHVHECIDCGTSVSRSGRLRCRACHTAMRNARSVA